MVIKKQAKVKCLEIILVRSGNPAASSVRELLNELIDDVNVPGLVETSIYTNASIPGDFTITLGWETEQPGGCFRSELAYGLIQEVKRLGLVDHSMWIALM